MAAPIQIEGLKELQRAARKAADSQLPKRLGEANKRIGALVVSKLDPAPNPLAVGAGAGSSVRPSASKREVLLRVGGAHRASGVHTNKQPWGRQRVAPPGVRTPKRPNIQGTAAQHLDEIEAAFLEAIVEAFRPAFHDTDKGN